MALNCFCKRPQNGINLVVPRLRKAPALTGLLAGTACLGTGGAWADVPTGIDNLSFGGGLALTSNYIYHGVSQSDGHGAVQGDLHLATSGGTFLGTWGSSRDSDLARTPDQPDG